ncbi:UDP-N-acetylglucosamine--dolichyl-phosphate N-acetylglucosaminephosphotransferase-like [Tropilaelaps mercedesae]|uniref:UDP-N-acetylglucosamine--dolichyl-phosphate N-acetylglucosaminephosphotransferase n=1 Tax=Tropilaelaps mercedesae TaxID=418985 RepID=A0A1V9Y0C7_9ACAR|nr:UDP-N-acetylglucosamine--dolichyl-phosphate N-acetylglucosaminephosphotransferase-like [Tropilaelaps mercedesae]
METLFPLFTNALMSTVCYVYTSRAIKRFAPMFIERGLFGIDLCKSTGERIAESLGVISATCFLVQVFLFIPIPFLISSVDGVFAYDRLVEILAALLSICCMVLLGFADDVLDLKWRDKLILPTLGSLPLLMVYYVNVNETTVIVPKPLRFFIGATIYLGPLYYVYMGMLAVFCTNAINILAGVNGLEVGQSLVIAGSIMIFNIVELFGRGETGHLLSLYLMPAFFATSLALYKFNKYPSKVFVGDTFCFFAGMTFACAAILGHFSKAMLLFFIPQIINFLYSTPQLFKLVPCPRHRLPAYKKETGLLSSSTIAFREDSLPPLGCKILRVLRLLRLVQIEPVAPSDSVTFEMNNLTIINLALVFLGPLNEGELVRLLLKFQMACSAIAFVLYYTLGHVLF